jgi:hypothetical protein
VYQGESLHGKITGIDDIGRLKIRFADEEKVFGIKEIAYGA